MKNSLKFILVLSITIHFAILSKAQTIDTKRENSIVDTIPQVTILGVFHFASTSDYSAILMQDLLGEKRQKEIMDLIKRIEKFRPTKILLEFPYSETDRLNTNYNNYLLNKAQLSSNEVQQLGFRLGKKLGHKKLYGIDYKLDLPFKDIIEYCEKNDKKDEFEVFLNNINSYTKKETDVLSKMILTEYLSRMNSDQTDRITNELYLNQILTFGDNDNEVGANVSSVWFKRNLIILNNISKVIDNEADRILIIIGSAHRALIKDFIEDRSDMEYVEIGKFLD